MSCLQINTTASSGEWEWERERGKPLVARITPVKIYNGNFFACKLNWVGKGFSCVAGAGARAGFVFGAIKLSRKLLAIHIRT